ncbi:hypothetical protein PHYPO_G00194690 [Pangasianodon hypophthalmus]|uniref:Uncharacterized protein n=1 Tax=Pangasianodon hypophthalmus TaxID=310915 RepID=A0A5N5PIG4_PANHP|nr:hypothetical protein PHYPO_G00194690 [Pangasianodon hypophthalmus]
MDRDLAVEKIRQETMQARFDFEHGLETDREGAAAGIGEDTFELHSVDLELEAAENQSCDLQVKQAQLRQRKSWNRNKHSHTPGLTLTCPRTTAHQDSIARPPRAVFVHSGAGVPRSLDAAAVEDMSQDPGKDLSPPPPPALNEDLVKTRNLC